MKLTATNLEIASSCSVRGKVDQEGEYTAPAKLFFDFVSLLPSEQVDLEVADGTMRVTCGGSTTKMVGLPASEFPLIPPVAGGTTFKLSADGLRGAISQVLFSVAASEARPELSGVCMRFHDTAMRAGKVALAATDSYRLSERLLEVSGAAGASQVIVPARTMAEVARVIGVSKDDVETTNTIELTIADNQVAFRLGSIELTSRTIEGRYPDYRQIIPATFKTNARVETQALAKAVKTASLFSRTGLFDVRLEFLASDGLIVVSGSDTARGENSVRCPATIEGENTAITVNYRYVLDGLAAVGEAEVDVRLIDAMNPCLIAPHTETGKSDYVYIVMPIKQ